MPKRHKHKPHKSTPFPKAGLLMWGLASLFYFYDYLLQVAPGAMKPELYDSFDLDAVYFGTLSAMFHYAYGIMQIPAGMLLDKFGPRRVLTQACALSTIGCLFFAIAETRFEANMSRLLMGVGAAFALMGCFKIASIWFAKHHFAFITGATITIGFFGAVVGLFALPDIMKLLHWRHSMGIAAIIGLVGTFSLYAIIRDRRPARSGEHAGDAFHEEEPRSISTKVLWKGLKTICTSKPTWYAAIYSGLMFCPTLAFALWGVPFLVEAQGFERELAGKMTSFLYIGWLFGAPFFGWVSDRFGNRVRPMYVASLSTLIISIALIYFEHMSSGMISGLLFGLGFASSGFVLSFVVIREINPIGIAGTALGFANTLNTLIGAMFQPLIGILLEWTSRDVILNEQGDRLFQLNDYQNALSSLIFAIALSILLLTRVPETGKGVGTAD
jgi:sugar phosphate permease